MSEPTEETWAYARKQARIHGYGPDQVETVSFAASFAAGWHAAQAEVASLAAERDRLLDEAREPCPLDHGCDPEETCGCWCMLHDCAIDECPTFKTVERWLAGMHDQHEGIVASLTSESDRLRDLEAKARAWRAAVLEVDEADDLDNEISLLDELDGAISAQRRLAAAVDALDGAPGEATP